MKHTNAMRDNALSINIFGYKKEIIWQVKLPIHVIYIKYEYDNYHCYGVPKIYIKKKNDNCCYGILILYEIVWQFFYVLTCVVPSTDFSNKI